MAEIGHKLKKSECLICGLKVAIISSTYPFQHSY